MNKDIFSFDQLEADASAQQIEAEETRKELEKAKLFKVVEGLDFANIEMEALAEQDAEAFPQRLAELEIMRTTALIKESKKKGKK